MAVVSMKFSNGYSGIKERSHLGCPLGMSDLQMQDRKLEMHFTSLYQNRYL
jgi:hypothetical protein